VALDWFAMWKSLVLFAILFPSVTFADSACVTQSALALLGTTCTIFNASFTFVTEDVNPNPFPTTVIFTPDVGDSGFTLSGFSASDPNTTFDLLFTAQTIDHSATIIGLNTNLVGPVTVIGDAGTLVSTVVACSVSCPPTNIPFSFVDINAVAGLNASGPQFFSAPQSMVSAAAAESAVISSAGDTASFTAAHYEILQTPEPHSAVLLIGGIIGIALGGFRQRLH
jgi:hypothetical protein